MTPNNAFLRQATGAIYHWTGDKGRRGWQNKGTPGNPGSSWTPGEILPIQGPPGQDGHPLTITIRWPATYQEWLQQAEEQAQVHTTDFCRLPHQFRYFGLYCDNRYKTSEEMQGHLLTLAGKKHPPIDTIYEWLHNTMGAFAPDLLRGLPNANQLPFMAIFTGQITINIANTMDMNMGNVNIALREQRMGAARHQADMGAGATTDAGATTGNDQTPWTQRDMDIIMGHMHRNTVELQQQQAALQEEVAQVDRTIAETNRNTAGANRNIIKIHP